MKNDTPNGPFKSNLDKLFNSDTAGVSERTFSEYRYKNGDLWLYTFSRKYFGDGDYLDSNTSKTFVSRSVT
tara:strand:- start:934 stop:1146 length:213 start_codon:yes stop_codon:yes gene_type:complete